MTVLVETTDGREAVVAALTDGDDAEDIAGVKERDISTSGIIEPLPSESESADAARREMSLAETTTTVANDDDDDDDDDSPTTTSEGAMDEGTDDAEAGRRIENDVDDDVAAKENAAEVTAPVQSIVEPFGDNGATTAMPPSPTMEATTGEKHERTAAPNSTSKPEKKSNKVRPKLIPNNTQEEEGDLGFGHVVAVNSPSQQHQQQQQQQEQQKEQQSNTPRPLHSPINNQNDQPPTRSSNVRDLQKNIQAKLNRKSYQQPHHHHRSSSTRALEKRIKEESVEEIEPPTEGAEFPSKLNYWKAVEGKNVFVPSRKSVSYSGDVKVMSTSSRREKTSVPPSSGTTTTGTAARAMVAAALAEAESIKNRKDATTTAKDGGEVWDSGKGKGGSGDDDDDDDDKRSGVALSEGDDVVDAMVKEALLEAERLQESIARDDDAKVKGKARIAFVEEGEEGGDGNDGGASLSMGAEGAGGVEGLQVVAIAKTDDEENAMVDANVETSQQTMEDAMEATGIVAEKEEEDVIVESTVEVETDQTKEVVVTEVSTMVDENDEEKSVTAASAVEVGAGQTLEVVVTEATAIIVADDNDEVVPDRVGIELPLEVAAEATTVLDENDIDVTDKKGTLFPPPVDSKSLVPQPTPTEPNTEGSTTVPEEPTPDTTTTRTPTTTETEDDEGNNETSLSDSDSQLIVPSASSDESCTSSGGSKSSRDYVKIVRTSAGDAMSESEFLSRPIVGDASSFAVNAMMDGAPTNTPSDGIPSPKSGGTSDVVVADETAVDGTVAEVVTNNDDTQKEGSDGDAPTLDVSGIREEALARTVDATPTITPANNSSSSGNGTKKKRNKNKKKKGKKR